MPPLLKEVEHALFDALLELELDGKLLSSVLMEIEDAIGCMEVELSSSVKADLAVMIYRASKPTGKVDMKFVNDAVRMASKIGNADA